MNNFVVSNPAEVFLDLLRVLITSPFGKTTVFKEPREVSGTREGRKGDIRTTLRSHSALAVPYLTAFATLPLDIIPASVIATDFRNIL
jgi:hypothetical protein